MYCKKCGTELVDGQKFCYKCGSKQDYVAQQSLQSGYAQSNSSISSHDVAAISSKKKNIGVIIAISVIGVVILVAMGVIGIVWLKNYSPKAKTAKLIEEAEQYYDDKDYDAAIEKYRDAIDITPDSVDAYKGLVKTYRKIEDFTPFIEAIYEAYEATGDDYFAEKIDEWDDDARIEDICHACEIREAILADIADGRIIGSGDLEVVAGSASTLSETYVGLGKPGRGCNFIATYDAYYGTCKVTLSGYDLTTEMGARAYKDAD